MILPLLLHPVLDVLPQTDDVLLWGMTGEAWRTHDDVLTVADLKTLVLPGLESLGVQSRLCPVPENRAELQQIVAERLRHGVRVPLLTVSPSLQEPPSDEEAEYDAADEAHIRDLRLMDAVPNDVTEFGTNAFLLLFTRAATKGGQVQNRDAVLLRWLAFAVAYPNRVVTANEADAFHREQCAAFLARIAGKQGTAFHNHLRQASLMLQKGAMEFARQELREAVLIHLDLPREMFLPLRETRRALTATERRELIYLARAGTLSLKILAVCRLKSEWDHPEVRSLLRQFQFDSHLWVRDAAFIAK